MPNKSIIKRITHNFSKNYALEPKKKARKKTKLTLERLWNIRERLTKSPNTSVRKVASQHGIHHSTAFVALKWLKLCVYRAILVQELKPLDPQKRLCFGERFSNFISHQCRGAVALDNFFFLAMKHGFIELGTLMSTIIDFDAVKIQMFLEKRVCILKKSAFGVHCEELVLSVRFFFHVDGLC